MIITIVGGVGLFLLGMLLMTEGLRNIAGSLLNRTLTRLTRNPLSGLFTGAFITTLVQSSSVTTLAVIGFVGAGLMTFPQSLGVIFGSNLGTTSTAWLVALIGFKVNIALMAFPLVAIGTLLKLFGSGKWGYFGSILAGFGLIFVGIGTMQEGMVDLADQYNPAAFPAHDLSGLLLLVLIGIGMTVVMQSSSAAMATTLAALYGSAINIEQATALVIGQNVGTTFSALLASVGTTVGGKRSALGHILFNLLTGIIAFLLLPWFVDRIEILRDIYHWTESTALAAFHTAFNAMGVILFLPLTPLFVKGLTRLLPDTGPPLTRHLDPKAIRVYPMAIEAARRATIDVSNVLVELIYGMLNGSAKPRIVEDQLHLTTLTLNETRRFLSELKPEQSDGQATDVSIYHAIDHLHQLSQELGNYQYAQRAAQSPTCQVVFREMTDIYKQLVQVIKNGDYKGVREIAEDLGEKSQRIAELRKQQRRDVLNGTAQLKVDLDNALDELEEMRWMDRTVYHTWRAFYHLQNEPGTQQDDPGSDDGTGEEKSNKKKKKKKKKDS
jgi:phosphate:Na+ symporter